ncbi:MAG TPA: FAD-dependent oxidoreductase [Candidatus Nanopelagicaceae bacterium]|nr:FAD-dependent oxidoreductase [Candidatus Nanopelagicaceae bacterium]
MAPGEVFCIVGAGLAGGRAAATLRELGFEGQVVLIGDEADPPYERPPLSKAFLLGQVPRARLLLRPAPYYREHGIELRLGARAMELQPLEHRLRLQDGSQLSYDRLLLATGSTARTLAVPGADLDGVMTLRTVQEAERLRALLEGRPRVLVAGAGFLGCELAAAASSSGCEVRLLELGPSAMPNMGSQVGEFVVGTHRRHGVEVEFRQEVTEFQGGQRVEAAVLADGRIVPCDLALVCVGATPNTQLAQSAGLELADGVVVDANCRSSDPDIFVAGDLASLWNPGLGRRLRLEHWDSAQRQGAHAAAAMLGTDEPYDPLPYFWSEQYEAMIQQVGLLAPDQQVVVREGMSDGSFAAFHMRQGSVVACVAVNRYSDLAAARRLIASGAPVEARALADPAVDLRQLATSLAGPG